MKPSTGFFILGITISAIGCLLVLALPILWPQQVISMNITHYDGPCLYYYNTKDIECYSEDYWKKHKTELLNKQAFPILFPKN